ncbi:MAG: hypothetical protein ABIA78_01830 [archaeon]
MKRRGLSLVVSVMIMIVLVITSIGIIWVAVINFVEKGVEKTESCLGIFEKVGINNKYTCYNSSSGEFQFSIDIGEINVDKIIVLISDAENSKRIEIENGKSYSDLRTYGGLYDTLINLPEKNAGLTYLTNFSNKPNSIEIAPVISETICEITDSLYEIGNC